MIDYNMSFSWKFMNDKYYYYNVRTGKVVGISFKYANHDVWVSLVYTGEYTFTQQDEKHLGQYIDMDFAKDAVVRYWEIQSRTLLEN